MIISLPIGAVILAELDATAKKLALHDFSSRVKDFLKGAAHGKVKAMLATGGTASSLAMLAQQLTEYNAAMINGFYLSGTKIYEIHNLLSALPVKPRKVPPWIEDRQAIIISGLEIYQEILATIGAKGMIVSDAGLLEGILYSITMGCLNQVP